MEVGEEGMEGWGKGEIIYLSLHCHRQNDSCVKMRRGESHFNVSLIVREKGEPKWYLTDVLPLTSLTPYRWAKPALREGETLTILLYVHRNGSVKAVSPRRCAATSALRNRCYKDNVRCTAVEEQPEAKEVQLLQPSSTSLPMISSGLT